MALFNLVWIFIIIIALVPLVRQRMLEATRERIMRQLEHQRGSRVIAMIHRLEAMSILGFPVSRYIDIQDSEQVLRAIQLTDPEIPLDIILHTPGGLALAAEQIANALYKHPGKVTVFVPHYAMSGGTLIALAADQIVMDENAVLGPLDPQVGGYPAVSILSVLADKPQAEIDDQTYILANISQKAIRQTKETIQRIAGRAYSGGEAVELAEKLGSGEWTHDYPISVEQARSLGLKVSTEMPIEVYQLMNLYPQSGVGRPSVQYIPVPYTNHKAK
jgi:ClpP class serine protease